MYRVVESVPDAYTSKTYNIGDGAYYQTFHQDERRVISREFSLEEAREQGKPAPVQTINITNIPRSGIALTKYNAGYGASADDMKSQITFSRGRRRRCGIPAAAQNRGAQLRTGGERTDERGGKHCVCQPGHLERQRQQD